MRKRIMLAGATLLLALSSYAAGYVLARAGVTPWLYLDGDTAFVLSR